MNQTQKQNKKYLSASVIYRYLLGLDSEIDTLILCKSSYIKLLTSDQSIYEAVGAIENKQDINYHKLTKLLEVCEIRPFQEIMKAPRKILTEKRVEQIRNQKITEK
jgi:hypothetical protein